MGAPPNLELNRRLTRLLFFRRLKLAAFWGGLAVGFSALLGVMIFMADPDLRARLRNDRLGEPVEVAGTVVGMYVPDTDDGYRPPIPVVQLENGHRVPISHPRFFLRKGDAVVVEVRTYQKSGEKKYRIIRRASNDP